MKLKRLLSCVLAGAMVLSLTACVDQHPDESSQGGDSSQMRLIATSPAAADICDKLNLDLVGVCQTSSSVPDRYKDVITVGMAMNPDLEVIKSLSPDYVLSPNSLQSDLQPKR